MDSGHVRNGTAPICTPAARSPSLASLAQAGDQFGTRHTVRHGERRGVDVLVADLERRGVRLYSAQYARDLLRRLPIAQQSSDVAPQRLSWAGRDGYRAVRESRQRAVAQAVHDSHRPVVDGRASGIPLSSWSSRCVSCSLLSWVTSVHV